jgi:hypothetical protein
MLLERGESEEASEVANKATLGGVAVTGKGAISDAVGTSISPLQIAHTKGFPDCLTSANCALRQRRQRK